MRFRFTAFAGFAIAFLFAFGALNGGPTSAAQALPPSREFVVVRYDVPGVIGYIGTVMGKNGINIANFSLGREETPIRDSGPAKATAIISCDAAVPEHVISQLLENPNIRLARNVEF